MSKDDIKVKLPDDPAILDLFASGRIRPARTSPQDPDGFLHVILWETVHGRYARNPHTRSGRRSFLVEGKATKRSLGARRARNRRCNAVAKQSRKRNR